MANAKKPYDVGYKKPPVEHQFKPGQSGNPAGRPQGRRNVKSLLLAAANREVQVTVGSRKVTMTQAEALFELVFKRALSGDLKILPIVMELMNQHFGDDEHASADPTLEQQERELVNQLLALRDGGSDEPSTH
jgi:hypothetical protein